MTKEIGPAFGQSKVTRYNCFIAINKKKKTAAKTYVINASLFFIAPEIRKRRISKNDI